MFETLANKNYSVTTFPYSVLIKPVKYYNISDKIHFNLVKKESGSSFVINSESSTTDRFFPTLSDDDVIYSKAVIASVSDVSFKQIQNIFLLF